MKEKRKINKTLFEKNKVFNFMLCYYEWLDTLLEDCTPEEAGYLLMGLIHYDRFGGAVALPVHIEEKLASDRALKMLFTLCMEKVAAGSREWINKHKLKDPDREIEPPPVSDEIPF